jgi:putative transposase
LFHSDRGSQYASADFVDLIGVFEVTQSMSRAAEGYDHAVMESFFASYTSRASCDAI